MTQEELLLAIKSTLDAAGFKQVASETKAVESHAASMGASFAKALGVATLAAGGLAVAVVGIGRAAMSITEGNAQFERYNVQLATLLGSAEAAKERMAELSEFGAKTPFELPQLVEAEKVLVGFGLNTEKTTKLAGMNLADFRTVIGDVAAGTGKDFAEVALTFGKFSAGATGESLARLQEMGVVTKEQLAAVGIEFSKSGQLLSPLPEAFAAATKIAKEKFGGGMDALSGTFEGQMSTLADTWGQIKRTLAAPIFDALKSGLNDFLPALGQFTVGFDAAKADGLDPFQSALAGVTAVLAALGVDDAEAKVKAFGDTVKAAATFVREDLWPALLNVGSAVVSLGKFLVEHKGTVLTVVGVYAAFRTALAINKAVAAVGEALAATKAAWLAYKAGTLGATLATTTFGTALKVAMGPIGWLIIAVGLLYAAWKTNFGGIQEKTEAVVNWFKSIPSYFKGAWDKVIGDVVALVAEWKRIWLKIKEHPVQGFGDLIVFLLTLPTRLFMIGVDIIEGLLRGIKRAWDGLKRWLTGAAGAIPQAVKASLKMQSPPPAMIEIGWWIGEAMRLGIVKSWPGVIQTADEFARAVVAKLGEATARVDVGLGIADAARAAVAAALAADGVIQGKRESAADAWGRYYEEQTRREDELHNTIMDGIEEQRRAETAAHEKNMKDLEDLGVGQKRYFDWLKSQQDQEASKTGIPAGLKLPDFSIHKTEIAAALSPILEILGFKGPEALANFWKQWTHSAQAEINTTEDLGKAIDAVLSELGIKSESVQKEIDARWDATAHSEEERHKHALANLLERKKFIDALIQAQADAEADLADLIAERDRLLAAARTELANAQKAAEEGERRVHAGVMAGIAAERAARTGAHKARMILLEDERKALEAGHAAELNRLQKQRDKITEGFEERERQIAHDRTALDQLKLDLGVDEAVAKLAVLEQKLNDMKAVAESFQVALRGREAGEAARKAIIERTRITTDAQRQALQAALDSGTLDEKDRRRVELLLLGRGTQRLTDVKRILAAGQEVLQGQIDYQRAVVEANQTAIAAREHLIELAEKILKIDRDNAVERLAAIDKLITAENDRYDEGVRRLTERMTLEQQRYDAEMDFLDRMADAEDKRHEKRMTDIAAEYALELAKLGMTSAEIDALVARAQAEAARIAQETEDTFKRMREEAEKASGLAEAGGLGISKPVPITPINPGGPIGGLRPGGGAGGSLVLDLSKVTAATGTIDKVELGGVSMTGTQVSVQVGGRDVAGVVVDELLGDVTLLDKLGKKLNERRATGGQIGGGP